MTENEQQGLHLKKLIQVIRSCGVSFDVCEQRNADRKASEKHDWTSLLGADKKILLDALPDKMKSFHRPEKSDVIVKMWKDFHQIYKIVNNWAPEHNPTYFFIQAKEWINCFLQMNGKREGYEKSRITPYMHIMVAHIPRFLELCRSVKIFTGQGVERNNNMARGVILRKSNKWDSAGDVLRLEQRQRELRDHEREAHSYVKRKESYWDGEIKKSRQKRNKSHTHLQSSEVHDQQFYTCSTNAPATGNTEFSKMTVHQLRDELKKKMLQASARKTKLS